MRCPRHLLEFLWLNSNKETQGSLHALRYIEDLFRTGVYIFKNYSFQPFSILFSQNIFDSPTFPNFGNKTLKKYTQPQNKRKKIFYEIQMTFKKTYNMGKGCESSSTNGASNSLTIRLNFSCYNYMLTLFSRFIAGLFKCLKSLIS